MARLRLVADAVERDEVVHRVWLEALAHAPREASLQPWLTVVLRNVARMRFRPYRRRRLRHPRSAARHARQARRDARSRPTSRNALALVRDIN
jgi:DNA-directed RNA polymerase specialized sigma24 family protein